MYRKILSLIIKMIIRNYKIKYKSLRYSRPRKYQHNEDDGFQL